MFIEWRAKGWQGLMNDEIISANEIYLQDVACSIVANNVNAEDFVIYNKVITMIDVYTFEQACKVLELIKLNKLALKTEFT